MKMIELELYVRDVLWKVVTVSEDVLNVGFYSSILSCFISTGFSLDHRSTNFRLGRFSCKVYEEGGIEKYKGVLEDSDVFIYDKRYLFFFPVEVGCRNIEHRGSCKGNLPT